MKRIVYTRPDGGLSIVTPVEGGRLASRVTLADGAVLEELTMVKPAGLIEVAGRVEAAVYAPQPQPVDKFLRQWPVDGATVEWAETEDEFVARVAAKDVPAELVYAIVDESALPADRYFRNAWRHDNGVISHDLAKCRAIQKDKLRAARAPLLAAQDVAFQRALASGGDAKALAKIEAEKQRLRDITKSAETAKSPDELRAITVDLAP